MRFTAATIAAIMASSAMASPILGLFNSNSKVEVSPGKITLPKATVTVGTTSSSIKVADVIKGIGNVTKKAKDAQTCVSTNVLDGLLNNVGAGNLPEVQENILAVAETAKNLVAQLSIPPLANGPDSTTIVKGATELVSTITDTLHNLAPGAGLAAVLPIIGTPIVEALTEQQGPVLELLADLITVVQDPKCKLNLAQQADKLCYAYAVVADNFNGIIPIPVNLQNLLSGGQLGEGLLNDLPGTVTGLVESLTGGVLGSVLPGVGGLTENLIPNIGLSGSGSWSGGVDINHNKKGGLVSGLTSILGW